VNYSGSNVLKVHDWKDAKGRGRVCMTVSTLLASVATQLTTGMFLTGYLLLFDMDKVSIGIVTFIPYITSLLSIFSPILLERFEKRRYILIAMKVFYYLVNILGVTILPQVISDSKLRLWGFVAIIFISNSINYLAGSGWTAWHANFLPDNMRLRYFQVSSCIISAFTYFFSLLAAFLGDSVAGGPNEQAALTFIRVVGLIVGILDCLVWLIPREFPYLSTERVKLSAVFRLPVKNKKFMYIVALLTIHAFIYNILVAILYAWLLDDVKIGYSTISAWQATYFLFFLFFNKFYQKIIAKLSWYKSWALENILQGVHKALYVFLPLCPVPLFWILGILEHFISAFSQPIKSSLLYVALPEDDRTYYLSFQQIITNCATFLGMMFGTFIVAVIGERTLNVGGFFLSSTQVCAWIQAVLYFLFAFLCLKVSKSKLLQDDTVM